jgi:hypothetical protein
VNKVFTSQLVDLGRGILDPLGPLGYFGLPLVNPGKPPLSPNRPYCQPLNYLEYVKDSDPMFMSELLKLPLKQMVKHKMQKLLIYLVLPSEILCLISVTITWELPKLYFCKIEVSF